MCSPRAERTGCDTGIRPSAGRGKGERGRGGDGVGIARRGTETVVARDHRGPGVARDRARRDRGAAGTVGERQDDGAAPARRLRDAGRRTHRDGVRDPRAGGSLRLGRSGRRAQSGTPRASGDAGRSVRASGVALRGHVRRSGERAARGDRPRAGRERGAGARHPPGAAALHGRRAPRPRAGAALHRGRGLLPGRDRGRRPPRGRGRSGRRARGRPGVRRSVAGPGVPRGARMNSRLRPADRAAPDYWLMPHRDVRRILPRLSLTLLLAWLLPYPILVAVADAARGDALGTFVSRTGEWAALWASVWVSLASVVLAAAIGVPLALLFEWLDFPGRKTLGSLVALPAVLPPFVGVVAFRFP